MGTERPFVPRPRRSGLITQELEGELLFYVEETHQACALNGSARGIWALCDGTRSVDAIATATNLFPDVVLGALRKFSDAGLLENTADLPRPHNMSRRRILANVALVAIPVVMLVTAPRAEACASKTGAPCKLDSDCCSGTCDHPSDTCA